MKEKRKRRRAREEQGRIVNRESFFFEAGGISLGNSTKDHRLLTARDIKQFCSPNTAPPSLVLLCEAYKHLGVIV